MGAVGHGRAWSGADVHEWAPIRAGHRMSMGGVRDEVGGGPKNIMNCFFINQWRVNTS
jgi:hypothetical protein